MATVNYHINKKGDPSVCKAQKGNCPLGGEHFDSLNDAEKFIQSDVEKKSGEKILNGLSKSKTSKVNVNDVISKKSKRKCFNSKIWVDCNDENCHHSSSSNAAEIAVIVSTFKTDSTYLTTLDIDPEYVNKWRSFTDGERQKALTDYALKIEKDRETRARRKLQQKDKVKVAPRNENVKVEKSNINVNKTSSVKKAASAGNVNNTTRVNKVIPTPRKEKTWTYGGTTIKESELVNARVIGGWNMSFHSAGPKITTSCGKCAAERTERFDRVPVKIGGYPVYRCPKCGFHNTIRLKRS